MHASQTANISCRLARANKNSSGAIGAIFLFPRISLRKKPQMTKYPSQGGKFEFALAWSAVCTSLAYTGLAFTPSLHLLTVTGDIVFGRSSLDKSKVKICGMGECILRACVNGTSKVPEPMIAQALSAMGLKIPNQFSVYQGGGWFGCKSVVWIILVWFGSVWFG